MLDGLGGVVGADACVEGVEVGLGGACVADAVEQAHELRVVLPVDFAQLDGHELELTEGVGGEEIGGGIVAAEDVAGVGGDDGFELEDVADQEKLFAAEGEAHVAGVDAQDLVDEVDDVGADHRDFVDDDEVEAADEAYVVVAVVEAPTQAVDGEVGVFGRYGLEGAAEKGVEGLAADVDGGDAGGSEDDEFLACVGGDVAQEGALAGAGFAGEEDGAVGVAQQAQCGLELGVLDVYADVG